MPNVLSLGMQILPQSLSKLTRYAALCTLFIAGTSDLKAQNIIQKLSKKFLSAEKDSTRSGSFMVLPAVGYAQETGVEYGLASSYNFYLDKSDPHIRTSTMTLMGTFTSKRQSNFKFQTDLWTKITTTILSVKSVTATGHLIITALVWIPGRQMKNASIKSYFA
ncbi:hypothetical protein KUH03_11710 [Sphingobacterium sp. E70]|uniref:hypothetical protein n=1 Tax=Sphingobacterium sp. E70 TaxID=2853439 RepID=UPI00211BB987|nr:hypothetical protein [Sphingobacterium sp. E70]ULT27347.1 hypothetical protein KUH03_11710 [Sphingobacterium sp. E70]